MATKKQIDHFWNRVSVGSKKDCWNWKSALDKKGYGDLRFFNRHTRAHKVALEIFSGNPVGKGVAVKHTCENILCCNPSHLYLSEGGNESAIWEKEFWARIKIGAADDCWPWIGKSKHHFGYGLVRRKWTKETGRGKMSGTHIIAYELKRGATKGLQVLHECDNPPCCNPEHLFLGTQKNNIDDMIKKGRDVRRKGEEKKNSKITNKIVSLVRRIYVPYKRGFSAGALAKRFGISPSNMHNIIKCKAWKHVE